MSANINMENIAKVEDIIKSSIEEVKNSLNEDEDFKVMGNTFNYIFSLIYEFLPEDKRYLVNELRELNNGISEIWTMSLYLTGAMDAAKLRKAYPV